MSLLLALTGGTAPSDPFLVPDQIDEVLSQEALDADASAYWQLDDDPAQPDTLSFDLSFNDDTETNPVELSAYAQVDDDAAQPDTALSWQDDPQDAFDELDGSSYQQLDDDLVAQPDALLVDLAFDDSTELDAPDLSAYAQIDDDAQPDTIFGAFDFLDESGLLDSAESFYYRQDDDAAGVAPPTGSGGAAGKTYVISGGREPEPRNHYVPTALGRPVKREPFEVKPEAPTALGRSEEPDLKQLRDRLLDLGRALERNKQAVKDRIRVEQAKPLSPDLLRIMQLLINEYEWELYNQNAARLVILMSEL